jgi:threonine aldolase
MPLGNPFPESQRDIVDLRSDTVTRPTQEMYEAMLAAPLGDDVLEDDPTVTALEELAADLMGKEAAMLVPSGTMGNQIAIACHTKPGEAILVEEDAHVLLYEVGAPAVLSNVVTWTLTSDKGVMAPDTIRHRIQKGTLHTPRTTLLCIENTHNRAGGTVVPLSHMEAYRGLANEAGINIHLDGARVFNAAAALEVPVGEITQHVDTVNFCLSKGLASPIGSVLCGPKNFIQKARVWRKRLGGGMRQAGLLAACGIVSLKTMTARLADDHRRARALAAALDELPGIDIDWDTVQTNMVFARVDASAEEWVTKLHDLGVWILAPGPNVLRLVFHADVNDAKLEKAKDAFSQVSATVSCF